LARELIILPRFKRDYRTARKHPDFDVETLEYVFDVLISGENLPSALCEHRLRKGRPNWTGLTVCRPSAAARDRPLRNRQLQRLCTYSSNLGRNGL
jgi:mRNA-degrading endonuclease YafQ of YafQ-DinJ toxin-antitoxin module